MQLHLSEQLVWLARHPNRSEPMQRLIASRLCHFKTNATTQYRPKCGHIAASGKAVPLVTIPGNNKRLLPFNVIIVATDNRQADDSKLLTAAAGGIEHWQGLHN